MKLTPMSILYIILGIIFSIMITMKFDKIASNVLHMKVEYGFFAKMLGFIFATVFSYIGALIGDFISKLAIPDVIYTEGSIFSILKEKFFWFIVPQFIGIFCGGAIGAGVIVHLFK